MCESTRVRAIRTKEALKQAVKREMAPPVRGGAMERNVFSS